jgi:hypothetical protein
MKLPTVNVAGCPIDVALNNVFRYLVLLLLLKLLVVLHDQQLAFGARVEIDNLLYLFLYTAHLFVLE